MRLRSRTDQTVKIPALDLAVDFATGEELRTEVSAKFREQGVRRELAMSGLELTHDLLLRQRVPGTYTTRRLRANDGSS